MNAGLRRPGSSSPPARLVGTRPLVSSRIAARRAAMSSRLGWRRGDECAGGGFQLTAAPGALVCHFLPGDGRPPAHDICVSIPAIGAYEPLMRVASVGAAAL